MFAHVGARQNLVRLSANLRAERSRRLLASEPALRGPVDDQLTVASNDMLGSADCSQLVADYTHMCRTRMGTRVLDGRDYRVVSTVPRACDFAGGAARASAFRDGIIARVSARRDRAKHADCERYAPSSAARVTERSKRRVRRARVLGGGGPFR